MEFASGLMDSIGERLTGSPNMKRANEWTRDQFTAMGLSNSHLEAWGPFGRGWANQYVNVRMTSPDVTPLLAYAKAWTPGTNGVVSGKCIRVTIEDKKDFDKYKGKLAGMIVILGTDADVKPITEAPYKRLSDDDLAKIGEYQIPSEHPPFRFADFLKRRQFMKELNQFFADEKVLAVIDHSRGTAGGGTVFVQSGGSYKPGETTTVPQLTMAVEHWTRIARLLQQKKDVTLELNVSQHLLRRRSHAVRHHRRDPRHRQEGRSRHAGRPPRLLARGHRRHRQRRRHHCDDGSRPHPQGPRHSSPGAPSASACGAAKRKACSDRRVMSSIILARVRQWTNPAQRTCQPFYAAKPAR